MKWFKHDSDARNDVKIKLLKQKFGAEGYGVYFQLIEIVAENVKDSNYQEWGMVETLHSVDTLALECGVSPDKLRSILGYCKEIDLLHKINNRLSAPKILDRLADYAKRRAREQDNFDPIQRKDELLRTLAGQTPDNDRSQTCLRTEKKREEKRRREESMREEKQIAAKAAVKDKSLTGYKKAQAVRAALA